MEKRIHVRDLAPFASSEDLSDERESPLDEEKQKAKLPNIEEEMKESSKTNLTVTNVAPRIDISRASSSSHQEDSSPERELMLGIGSKGSKLEVAFGEEIASDLHSSTEELSFHDPADADKYKKKKQSQTFSDLQNETLRKDSGCSDIALLSISGRTSRVSSVGSVASGGSGISNYSHCSARSHLSATSNLSRASRGSSPHRMSLETSFCGPKPVHSVSIDVDETVKSIADKLSLKTENVVETNVKDSIIEKGTPKSKKPVSSRNTSSRSAVDSKPSHSRDNSKSGRRKPPIENPKTQKFVSLHSDEEEEPIASKSVNTKTNPVVDNRTQIFIPLHGTGDENDKTCEPNPNSPKRLKPFTNTTLVNFISKYDTEGNTKRERRSTVSESKAEYHSSLGINEEFQKFISLKDDDDDGSGSGRSRSAPKHRRSVSNTTFNEQPRPSNQIVVPIQVYQAPSTTETAPSPVKLKSDLPKYLMTDDGTTQYIPLRGSDPYLQTRQQSNSNQNYLSVNKNELKSLSDDRNLSHLSPLISPNLGRHHKPPNLELSYRDHPTRSAKSMTQLINRDESRTPSPNASASNHNRLYRRCSESAKEIRNIEKPKSRSGSIKSLFSSFFKRSGSARTKKTNKTDTSRSEIPDAKITNVEFTFKQPPKSKGPDRIIIPLHSDDEVTPTDVKCYGDGDDPRKEVKKENSNTTENKTNISDKIVEKSTASTTSSPKTKTVSYETNFEQKTETRSTKSDIYIECKKETVKEIRIVERTSISSSPEELEKKIEIYKLECEVTVHNEASTPIKSQPDSKKAAGKEDNEPSSFEDQTDLPSSSSNNNPNASLNKPDSTTGNHKKMSNHEVDGEEGDISTDSDRVTLVVAESEEEHKTLVNTSESFEEELPYVPTTLPLERSVAVPIVPIKERVIDIKMQPIDRPRSVTPLNPALLDNYVVTSLPSTVTNTDESSTTEKLHITLPRVDAATDVLKKKSPLTKKKTWQNFIEYDLQSPKKVPPISDTHEKTESPPPPLPPRKSSSWVSFDESCHEMRQSPRRITTLPPSYGIENSVADASENKYEQRIIFVNPDECSCECHETQHNVKTFQKQ